MHDVLNSNTIARSRLRAMLSGGVLSAAACIISLVIVELCLRAIGTSCSPYALFAQADPFCGWALRPSATGEQCREGHSLVTINSDGLRDREHCLTKPPGVLRIAVVGDSYAEAMQVSPTEAFWSVMQSALQSCSAFNGRRIEVINFGVSGYSTSQELQMLRHSVWKYSPDIVLLAVTTANDIQENSRDLMRGAMRPFFILQDGQLILDDSFQASRIYRAMRSPLTPLLTYALQHSRVLQFLEERRARLVARFYRAPENELEPGLSISVFKEPVNGAWRNAWAITEALIRNMNNEVVEHGAKFFVVTLTCGRQVDPNPAAVEATAAKSGITDFFYPDRRLRALGNRWGFEVLNLARCFQTYAQSHNVYLHGFANTHFGTGHWNAEGHRLAGELIASRLCRMYRGAGRETRPNEIALRSARKIVVEDGLSDFTSSGRGQCPAFQSAPCDCGVSW